MRHKLLITSFFVACTGLAVPLSAQTIQASDISQAQPAAPDIDYSAMASFMQKFAVVERGRPKIAYKNVRATGKPFLTAYTQYLTSQNIPAQSRDGQLAYWLNLQNLLVVKAIAESKKTNLKKLRGTGKTPGSLWTKPRVTIAGQNLSIANIEQKIVTGWSEHPNVIYGIYQGVKGAPCLSKTSYTATDVHARLEKLAELYVNARGIVSVKSQTAHVTPVYDWYKDALFSSRDGALIDHVRAHAYPNLASKLSRASAVDVVKLNYKADVYVVKKPRSYNNNVRSSGGGGYGS